MQQKSRTSNNKLTILLSLIICFNIVHYKDLKSGFVEGFTSYNATKSTHLQQQSSLIENDFYTIQLIMFNKNF